MTKNTKTIAEKTAELDALVAWFDSDEFVLEQATEQFAKARALANDIEADILALKNEITVLEAETDAA